MGRKRITEYAAKLLLYNAFDLPYKGVSCRGGEHVGKMIQLLDSKTLYVVKVDQGVKGRFKKGLVKLNCKPSEISSVITSFEKLDYSRFLIEPHIVHKETDEHYIAFERVREGIRIYASKLGGVDIESHAKEVFQTIITSEKEINRVAEALSISSDFIKKILLVFENAHFSFLEINPFLIKDEKMCFLDVACEVDSSAEFFVNNAWTSSDFATPKQNLTKEEQEVNQLAANSQASFKLDVLQKDGSIFVLLSGGGASVVIADEIYAQGYHQELANYGEYSGNPNKEETYLYAKALLSLLFKSQSRKKVLIIGGGVANFTDIRVTFNGIIQALGEQAENLRSNKVKVFVRRGGPYQEEGLSQMTEFLKREDLYGDVKGPDVVLTSVVLSAISYLQS